MRTLTLLSLILGITAVAEAQDFYPVRNPSTRYYFFGGWVRPPLGSGWSFQRKPGSGVDEMNFARGESFEHTWAASVTTMDTDPPGGREELSNLARLRAEEGQGRKVKLRSFESTPDSTLGPLAVRYHYQVEDRAVPYDKGRLYVLETRGLIFTHPLAPRRLIILESSQRAKDPIALEPDAAADSFFAKARLLKIDTAFVRRIPIDAKPEQLRSGPGAIWTSARALPVEGKPYKIATEMRRHDPESFAVQSRARIEGGIADFVAAYESLWACDFENGQLLRLDPTTLATTGTLRLGGHPHRILATTGALWVTDPYEGRIHIVDPSTLKPIGKPIRDLERPTVILEANDLVWVVNASRGSVQSFDPRTRKPVGEGIAIGQQLGSMISGGNSLWVTSGQMIKRLDPVGRAVTSSTTLGYDPGGLVFARDAVWVAHLDAGTLTRVDPATNAVVSETQCVGLDVSRPMPGVDGIWFCDAIANTFSLMRVP